MNLTEQNPFKPKPVKSSLDMELSLEFVRISKLSESGRDDEAWRAANALYEKYPKEATPNFIIALILTGNRQRSDALQYAEAAVQLAPGNAIYKAFLGKLYVEVGMIEFALDHLVKAFAIDKTLFQAPLGLAKYYFDAGQGAHALHYYDLALQGAPEDSIAAIRFYRASCLKSLGRAAEAEADFNAAMIIPERRVRSLSLIALLQNSDHTSEKAKGIRAELERTDLSDKDRSTLLLCLGRLHENGKDYDNAFMNFDRSRRLKKEIFEIDQFVGEIDKLIRNFTPEVFEKFLGYGHESDKPIFVVGMPRSGTTMTEQIIAAHSRADGVGESDRMGRMSKNLVVKGGMEKFLAKMAEVGPQLWKDIPRQYLNLVNVLVPDARYTVDKMPHNFLHLGFIHMCFPNARIIHCRRNPLDTFVSAYQNDMNTFHRYSFDQTAYGQYYIQYLRLMEHWKAVMPRNIYESSYEALTANPETEVRGILGFLGLPWEEACLKFNEREATVRTFSSQQVRNPINTGSVARWRKYEKHLGPIMAVFEQAGIRF